MATCIYQMTWTDKVTGEKTIHTCGEEIDSTKIAPYRQGHRVCHRHERGLAGWNPSNCKGVYCAPFPHPQAPIGKR